MGIDRASAIVQRRLGRAAQRVDELEARVRRALDRRLADSTRRLQGLDSRLRQQDLRVRLGAARARLDAVDSRLARAVDIRLRDARRRLERPAGALVQLSPLRVLDRGYAIVQDAVGHVLVSASDAGVGSDVAIRLSHGRLHARVTGAEE